LGQARFKDIASDIIEIDVHTLRCGVAQSLEDAALLVVDRGIEAEMRGAASSLQII
jgi:hypothetical protein